MMFTTPFLLFILCFTTALSAVTHDRSPSPHPICLTPDPSSDFLDHVSQLQLQRRGIPSLQTHSPIRSIVVDTYFHIVAGDNDTHVVTEEMIQEQYDVLHRTYASYGIFLTLVNTSLTINTTWSHTVTPEMPSLPMKQSLRLGPYSSLNIYFQTQLSSHPSSPTAPQILGFSTLPTTPTNTTTLQLDGCHVHAGSMPGGWVKGNNRGYSAVHEVGHWLGLLHTFEGYSCEGPGDYVDDTPQQKVETSGCPVGKNSCPELPGLDAIRNFMDYSSDECYREFTIGQRERMFEMWDRFRANSDEKLPSM